MTETGATVASYPEVPVSVEQDRSAQGVALALARLLRALPRVKAQLSASAQSQGLQLSSQVVLRPLVQSGPQRSSALAEALDLDPSWISRQVTHLVRDGLVERRVDPQDGRAILLAPTKAGEEACTRMHNVTIDFLAGKVAHWAEPDRRQLTVLLDRLADELETTGVATATQPVSAHDVTRRSHE